jgi:hypothetical protein
MGYIMKDWYTIPENEKNLEDGLIQLCYERMADSIPQGINTKEALRAGIRFVADCIHQINQSDDNAVMDASIVLLKAEFKVFQKVFKKRYVS